MSQRTRDDDSTAESVGAKGYIVKPIMVDDLINEINETLQSQ